MTVHWLRRATVEARRLLVALLLLSCGGCEVGPSGPENDPRVLDYAEMRALVQSLYGGNLLVYGERETLLRLLGAGGAPVPFERDVLCEGGGTARFVGTARLVSYARSSASMEVSDTMTTSGCLLHMRVCRQTTGSGGPFNLFPVWSECTWQIYVVSPDTADLVHANTMEFETYGSGARDRWELSGKVSRSLVWRLSEERIGTCNLDVDLEVALGFGHIDSAIAAGSLCNEEIRFGFNQTPRW